LCIWRSQVISSQVVVASYFFYLDFLIENKTMNVENQDAKIRGAPFGVQEAFVDKPLPQTNKPHILP